MVDASPRPELLALLGAIKAEPDDEVPRLVLADWLQEQDHPADQARGEFLRTCVQRDRLNSGDPAREPLSTRIEELWQQHKIAWTGSLIPVGFHFWSHSIHRGLLFPSIDGLQLTSKQTATVLDTEAYAWIGGLSFSRLSSRQLSTFAGSPLLDSLIEIHVRGCAADPSSIADLVSSPRAAMLKYFDVWQMRTPAAAISASAHLANLRQLSLRGAHVQDGGFRLLCDSPHLNNLRALDVTYNQLTSLSARAFAEAVGLPALTQLNLGGSNRIGPDGTRILVACPGASRLRMLNLWSNDVGDSGVEAICRQSHLPDLTHLDLSGNRITNRGAMALAVAERLKGLEELNLKTNGISSEGAMAMVNSSNLGNLRRLDLSGNRIGEKAAAALRERFGTHVTVD